MTDEAGPIKLTVAITLEAIELHGRNVDAVFDYVKKQSELRDPDIMKRLALYATSPSEALN